MIYFFITIIINDDHTNADQFAHFRQNSYVSPGSHHETHYHEFQDIYK